MHLRSIRYYAALHNRENCSMSERSDGARPEGKPRGRDKPWIFRTYAGHSTARASNELYRKNLAKGQTGLSVAFDLPTQTGYDSDHPLARGEVGKVGVPVSHLGDMRALFEDIPLGEMNTSMTINATAAWLLALYIAVADEHNVPREKLTGTTQNDIIKEYLSRGTHVFPPAPSMRLIKDTILFTTARNAEMESDERLLLPPAGSGRDAGAGTGLRARHRDRGARHREGLRPGRARRVRRSGRPHLVLRQCGPALHHRDVQDARLLPSCGTRSPRSATASTIPSSGCSATACRSIRSVSPSSSRRTTSTAS